MGQKICHTKRYAALGAGAYLLWEIITLRLLDLEPVVSSPHYQQVEIARNIISLLCLPLFLRCVILLFRERVLLQGGERGLAVRVSRKNRGVIPWRNINGFAYPPDRSAVRVYLQGHWDIPEGCGDRFDIQVDEGGKRVIALPLGHKVNKIDQACERLEEWRVYFSAAGGYQRPDGEEGTQRRGAAMRKRGLTALLIPLYMIRGKYWFLMLMVYLLLVYCVEQVAACSRPWMLITTAVPFLPICVILRYLLGKGISALERRREREKARGIGL